MRNKLLREIKNKLQDDLSISQLIKINSFIRGLLNHEDRDKKL
jgi:hypothetical protein